MRARWRLKNFSQAYKRWPLRVGFVFMLPGVKKIFSTTLGALAIRRDGSRFPETSATFVQLIKFTSSFYSCFSVAFRLTDNGLCSFALCRWPNGYQAGSFKLP